MALFPTYPTPGVEDLALFPTYPTPGEENLPMAVQHHLSMETLLDQVTPELEDVTTFLQHFLSSSCNLLTETSLHLVKSGGKGLRPALFFLAAKFGNYRPQQLVPLAAALEILHLATLVHDDVVDKAPTRRNRPSVNARWDDGTAILLGDYYYGKFLTLAVRYGDGVLTRLARVVTDLVEGEFMEQERLQQITLTEEEYLLRISKKSASLVAACCHLGALVSNAPIPTQMQLTQYGHYLGLAFQIQDDLLDFLGDEKVVGKPLGHDYQQGVFTLPLIHAWQNEKNRTTLTKLLALEENYPHQRAQLVAFLHKCGALQYTQELAVRYTAWARNSLAALPNNPARASLLGLADYLLSRGK